MTKSITLTAPDDWHIHLRDGEALESTVPHVAKSFERAIIMPNLVPPVLSAIQAVEYRRRIEAQIPDTESFTPLMVLYLTDKTSAEDIVKAKEVGVVACKLYPAGATTNSDSGVTHVKHIYSALEAMQKENIALLVHGEVTDSSIDIFDREKVFIDEILKPLTQDFPNLKIVLEHITTKDAVAFVNQANDNVGATITAHHLLYNRNHMLAGGIRPNLYCLPILKRNVHQKALIDAATSGNKKFFLGTDSAPHAKSKKEAACGCAGSYTAFGGLAYYAQVFDEANAMDKLEAFASHNGPDFYNLPRNTKKVRLINTPWTLPESFDFGSDKLVPIMAGETLDWQVQDI